MKNLAIVIPYFKKKFFDECLLSLATQSNKNFHVYIGNDKSPEDPQETISKYNEQISINYFSFKENLGGQSLVKQWQRCIALTGDEEWIMILGDDDSLEANCVELFYKSISEIEARNINVIRFATLVIDQNGKALSNIYTHPKLEKATDFLSRKLKGHTRSSLSEYIFNKEELKKTGFKELPLAWYSDFLAVMEFSEFGKIYTINDAVVNFRLSGVNITSKVDNMIIKNIASFELYYYLIKEKNIFFDTEQISLLCERLEKTFLDNKKKMKFWWLFTGLYFSRLYVRRYLFFYFKVLKYILNKQNYNR